MLRRLGHAVFAAFVALFLLGQATLIIAWIPSANYQAIAAGADTLLYDGGSAGALRVDQLSGVSSVLGSDTFPDCQSCGSATALMTATAAKIAAYVAGVISGQQNVWSAGQQLAPFTLTDASSVAVNFANGNVQTLLRSRSSSKISNPTGVSSGDRGTLTFEFTQPASGGPDDLSWDTAWWFPSGTPPIQANGGLTAANNAVDMLTCNIRNISGTITALCPFNGSSNFASSSQFALRGNHTCSDSNCSGSNADCTSGGTTTCSVTILNSVAGDLRTVEFTSCCVGTTSAPIAVSDQNGNTCTVDTASYQNGSTGGAATGIAFCPKIIGSSTATITVTFSQSVQFPFVFVQEWTPSTTSPLAGIGNSGGSASAANPSVSTNGATTQTGQLVIAVWNNGDSPVANACAQIDKETSTSHNLVSFSTSVSTCSLTATANGYDVSITSFLHY